MDTNSELRHLLSALLLALVNDSGNPLVNSLV